MKVVVIGGGAAGFFAALSAKGHHPHAEVIILEKSSKLLAKVKVSGGGRCNITTAHKSIKTISQAYPRGGKLMKKLLPIFGPGETLAWFHERGVSTYAQPDMRVFPTSDNSQSVIDCLLREAQRLSVAIKRATRVERLQFENEKWRVHCASGDTSIADRVIVASGGSPKIAGFDWLLELGHKIAPPAPSLFTFNMRNNPITKLMGVVAPVTQVRIQGTKYSAEGPLLITHWGMSGPAILKLSAFAARELQAMNYEFSVQINWLNEPNEGELRTLVQKELDGHNSKRIGNTRIGNIPSALWDFLLNRSGIAGEKTCREVSGKGFNKLINTLANDVYRVKGKTTFKEEFVTAGGICLDSVNPKTMESKVCAGLYFAGEVLDIDGITGGFNFQAAWTTGYLAGKGE